LRAISSSMGFHSPALYFALGFSLSRTNSFTSLYFCIESRGSVAKTASTIPSAASFVSLYFSIRYLTSPGVSGASIYCGSFGVFTGCTCVSRCSTSSAQFMSADDVIVFKYMCKTAQYLKYCTIQLQHLQSAHQIVETIRQIHKTLRKSYVI
jgi:hypothetical protein